MIMNKVYLYTQIHIKQWQALPKYSVVKKV
jgi:hypothetical protein